MTDNMVLGMALGLLIGWAHWGKNYFRRAFYWALNKLEVWR